MDSLTQRYALALALIPDPDVAGDLFMDARDEADLRRRAAVWRRNAGLPPLDLPAAAIALTPEQVEHATHLARRAYHRRRIRTALLGIAAAGALVAAGILFRPAVWRGPTGLAAAPAFARPPVESVAAPGRYRFSVYAAEATPGSVTVWWALEGPEAARSAAVIHPSLEAPDGTRIASVATETAGAHRDRLLGHSVYQVLNFPSNRADLALDSVASHQVNLRVTAPLTWLEEDPAATTVQVSRAGPGPAGEFAVQSVTLGPNYTLIRYHSPVTMIGGSTVQLIRVNAWGKPLKWLGALQAPAPQLTDHQDVFSAVPPGTSRLTIRFTFTGYQFQTTTYDLQRSSGVRDVVRSGSNVEIVLDAQTDGVAAGAAYLSDAAGNRYDLTAFLRQAVTASSTFYEYRLRASDVPPDARLVSLNVAWGRLSPPVEIQVDLPY